MKNYHPHRVTLSLGGLLIVSGFADGEFITFEWESDLVLDVVGTDGEVAASVSNDARGTLTVKLMQTSDENKKLEALFNLRKRGAGSIGVFPVLLKDNETGEVITAADAYVSRGPDLSFDRQASSREWKVRLANAEIKYL